MVVAFSIMTFPTCVQKIFQGICFAILDNAINSRLNNASSEKSIQLTKILAYPRRYKITTIIIIITIKTLFQGGNTIYTKLIFLAALHIYNCKYKNLIEHVEVIYPVHTTSSS